MKLAVPRRQRRRPLIFLSYRRSESRHVAGRLRDSLDEQFGSGSVFMDVEDIDAGADFIDAITHALQGCSTLLLIIGPQWHNRPDGENSRLWNADDVVRLEVEAALRLGVQVIPLLVDDAQMPDAKDLPPSLREITRRQAIVIDAARWRASVQDIAAAVKREPGDNAGASTRPARRVMAWGIAAELVIALVALQTVGAGPTPGLDIVTTATTVAERQASAASVPVVAQTRVEASRACKNDELGFAVQVPSGMDFSSDEEPPFANCEAFAFGEVVASHYKDEKEFSVPVMFAASRLGRDDLERAATNDVARRAPPGHHRRGSAFSPDRNIRERV
ncbi:MAG: hypothetical protein QOK28_924 [Actinomycetota bacterium]|jgi:hypothetical protein